MRTLTCAFLLISPVMLFGAARTVTVTGNLEGPLPASALKTNMRATFTLTGTLTVPDDAGGADAVVASGTSQTVTIADPNSFSVSLYPQTGLSGITPTDTIYEAVFETARGRVTLYLQVPWSSSGRTLSECLIRTKGDPTRNALERTGDTATGKIRITPPAGTPHLQLTPATTHPTWASEGGGALWFDDATDRIGYQATTVTDGTRNVTIAVTQDQLEATQKITTSVDYLNATATGQLQLVAGSNASLTRSAAGTTVTVTIAANTTSIASLTAGNGVINSGTANDPILDVVALAPLLANTNDVSLRYNHQSGLQVTGGLLEIDSARTTVTWANVTSKPALVNTWTAGNGLTDSGTASDPIGNVTALAPLLANTNDVSLRYNHQSGLQVTGGLLEIDSARTTVTWANVTSKPALVNSYTAGNGAVNNGTAADPIDDIIALAPLLANTNDVSLRYNHQSGLQVTGGLLEIDSARTTVTWANVTSKPALVNTWTAGNGLTDSGTASDPIGDVTALAPLLANTNDVSLRYNHQSGLQVTGGLLEIDSARITATWDNISGKPATFAPSAHAASHLPGGADALTTASVTGTATANLEGTSADVARASHQHAIQVQAYDEANNLGPAHSVRVIGSEISGALSGGTLQVIHDATGSRTPTAHASSHLPAGSDALSTANVTGTATANAAGTAESFARSDHAHATQLQLRNDATDLGPINSLRVSGSGLGSATVTGGQGHLVISGGSYSGDTDDTTQQFYDNGGSAAGGAVQIKDNTGLSVYNESTTMGMTITHNRLDASAGYVDIPDGLSVTQNVTCVSGVFQARADVAPVYAFIGDTATGLARMSGNVALIHNGGNALWATTTAVKIGGLGSAGSPSLIWLSESGNDSGLYSPANDQIGLSTGGVQRVLWTSDNTTVTTNGLSGSLNARLHSSTQGTTIDNDTTETDLVASITPSLSANSLRVGRHLRGTCWGRYSSAIAPGTMTIRVYKGTTLMLALPAATVPGSQTDAGWRLEWELEIETAGASGSAHLIGELSMQAQAAETVGVISSIIDTTSAGAWKVTADWSAAQAGDIWRCTSASMDFQN